MNSSNILFPDEGPSQPDEGYEYFKREFRALTGILLDLYKEKQMKRRIASLIVRKNLAGYEAFIDLLRAEPGELASFIDYITINVTEFFRTPEQWAVFEEQALTALTADPGDTLKVWSCACSTGEEPYSLAMSLCRLTEPSRFRILATDIDEGVLAKAKCGEYDWKSAAQIPEALRDRFFVRKGSGLCVSDALRSCTEFGKLDLLQDDYPRDCDLIVCRNVLIYFTERAKHDIYTRFTECLKPGGYLFTGNTEQIIYYKEYGLKKITGYLYQKP